MGAEPRTAKVGELGVRDVREAPGLTAQSWEGRARSLVPAPPLACCVILGKCLALSGPQSPHFVMQGDWALWI